MKDFDVSDLDLETLDSLLGKTEKKQTYLPCGVWQKRD